jgi:hypothetical protein
VCGAAAEAGREEALKVAAEAEAASADASSLIAAAQAEAARWKEQFDGQVAALEAAQVGLLTQPLTKP